MKKVYSREILVRTGYRNYPYKSVHEVALIDDSYIEEKNKSLRIKFEEDNNISCEAMDETYGIGTVQIGERDYKNLIKKIVLFKETKRKEYTERLQKRLPKNKKDKFYAFEKVDKSYKLIVRKNKEPLSFNTMDEAIAYVKENLK